MRKILITVLLISFFSVGTAFSQKGTWYFGTGIHFVDYYAPIKGEPKFKSTNWNGGVMPKWFSVGYGFTEALQFHTSLSFLKIEKYPGNFDYAEFLDWDINFQYHLTDGIIIPERFPVDPYIVVGGGLNQFDYWSRPSYNLGIGLNIWTSQYWAFNWQTTYDGVSQAADYVQHVFSVKVRVGSAKDTDGDGIPDHKDKCPEIPGSKEADGCPDRDGDGIADMFDRCPDVPGVVSNMGCPEINDEMQKTINDELRFSARNINFETSKDVIMKESFLDLENIVDIMNKFPTSRFSIGGHTDNTGNPDMNQKLSESRAQSVKKYFVDKGIDASRLDAKGYGDAKPIADNSTKEGRAANRRVEINIIR